MSKSREMITYVLNPQNKHYTAIKIFKHVASCMSIRSQKSWKKNKLWVKACGIMWTGKNILNMELNIHKYKNQVIK